VHLRLLRDKFRLGLFDNPYVDPAAAEKIVGSDAFRKAGEIAQRKSIVLLKNAKTSSGMALPIRGNPRIYVENVNPEIAGKYGQVVENVQDADVARRRLPTPYEHRAGFLDRHFHAGDLDFAEEEKAHFLDIMEGFPPSWTSTWNAPQ
jgi:beta-glucosidase